MEYKFNKNRINEKIKNFSKRGKMVLALFVVATIGISGLKNCSKNDKNNIYLVDLEDELEDNATLLDANNKKIKIKTKNKNELVAIVDEKKTKENEMYKVILVNKDGQMQSGYMDGVYLSNKALDTAELSDELFDEISTVSSSEGVWLRENKVIDRDTKKAIYLDPRQEVATSTITETSSDNSYLWKESIYCDKNNLHVGYIANDYLLNKDITKAEGKRFIVDTTSPLKLRPEATLDCTPITSLKKGTEVILIPNMPSISDGSYDWFYVACKHKNKIVMGYAAATAYTDGKTINYLVAKEKIKIKDNSKDKFLTKVVDTSSDGKVDLKLRKEPGTDSEIISKIVHGTTIHTFQSNLDECEKSKEKDGHKWIKVSLTTGETGYVASEYIKDELKETKKEKKKNVEVENEKYPKHIADFGKEGKIEGYLGIDVNNTTNYSNFESIIKNNNEYVHKASGIHSNQKPNFVYFKLGATCFGAHLKKSVPSPNNKNYLSNVQKMVALCEQYKVPYGFYYYSQATSKKDINIEAKEIKNLFNSFGELSYNIIPFAIDIEAPGTSKFRKGAQENGKEYQSKVINTLMNVVKNDLEKEVILYTDRNTLPLFDYSSLDEENKKDSWIVDPSATHSNNLVEKHKEVVENISIRQIGQDIFTGSGTQSAIDYNFINAEYFEKLMQEKLGIKVNKDKVSLNEELELVEDNGFGLVLRYKE